MSQLTLPLPDHSDSLLIEWEYNWSNFTVRFGQQILLVVPEKADLLAGRRFFLPDGQALIVVLRDPEIELWYKGKDLVSGIANGFHDPFQRTARNLKAIAGLQLVGAVFYGMVAPEGWKAAVAAVMVCFAAFLYVMSKKIYTPKYKTAIWFGLVGCFFVFPLIASRRGGLWWELTGSLLEALRAKPPHFASDETD